jgi:hypothetical protein
MKSVAEKSWQVKYGRKSVEKKFDRKSVVEKLWQEKCDRKIMARKVRQQNHGKGPQQLMRQSP